MENPERWLSVEEIATHIGVSKESIYRWLERKKIPAHKIGRLWKFKQVDVDNWIKRGGGTAIFKTTKKSKMKETIC